MSGPIISPTLINSVGKPVFSTTFGFSGGGTQTVLSLGAAEAYIFTAVIFNYGGADYRHGSIFYAARSQNGGQIRGDYLATQQSSSIFTLSGTADVQYNAGGGAPNTTIYILRLH